MYNFTLNILQTVTDTTNFTTRLAELGLYTSGYPRALSSFQAPVRASEWSFMNVDFVCVSPQSLHFKKCSLKVQFEV